MTRIGAQTAAGLLVDEHVLGTEGPDPLPIVLALHGRGGVPELPFGACVAPCRVLVPRGPFVVGDGFAWSTHYAREGNEEALTGEIAESADRLAALIAKVTAERGSKGRAIALGYSQGGVVALALAARHPASISELVVGATWALSSLTPSGDGRRLRIRMAHGEADDVVPFAWAQASALGMRARGLDVELRGFDGVTHEGSPELATLLAAWREEAIARAWGTSAPDIPELGRVIGPERLTERLWRRVRRALAWTKR